MVNNIKMIEKPPFTPMRLEEERTKDKTKTITVYLNPQEIIDLDRCKKLLQQEKDSTALKQIWRLGINLIDDNLHGALLKQIIKNIKNNKRIGIQLVE